MGQAEIREFLLGKEDNSATVDEMVEELGISRQSIQNALYRMQRHDEVDKDQDEYFDPATWFLTADVLSALKEGASSGDDR